MGKKIQYEICNVCKHKNNITESIELNDYDDSWRDGYILCYCQECGNQLEIRVKQKLTKWRDRE